MNNIVLIGFMGSGKSTVGRLLADRLGRRFRDLDDEIVATATGQPVAAIFEREGEAGFRRRESDCLRLALGADDQVIAVGGGAPLIEDNWIRMRDGNTVVALMAEPRELAERLRGSTDRPLLYPDPPTAVATLLPVRTPRYLEADLVIRTDQVAPSLVAEDLAGRLPPEPVTRVRVEVPGSPHEAVIGRGLGHLLAAALGRSGAGDTVVVVTDPAIETQHAAPMLRALRQAGLTAHVHVLPAGEPAKTIETLGRLYDRLAEIRVDRTGALIALGGGTVGDVTGFAAATWLRGIRYLQVPTTLLAMVDSSIGGKAAINLASGKNLVGAVHQPAAIFCDLDYLATLPDEEFRSGMAEVCKAAMIADRHFAEWLLRSAPALASRNREAVREAVTRAVRIKASVVGEDPTETGRRAILNYGHTVAHALERALGYGCIRHGEAVAWGMEVAGELSLATGRCRPAVVETQGALLRAHGLQPTPPRVSRAELLSAMQHDKKSRDGAVRWVLLRDIGDAEWGCDVAPEQVSRALDKVLGA